jgi:CubicO group peptidase (beta-lactamase class C family)
MVMRLVLVVWLSALALLASAPQAPPAAEGTKESAAVQRGREVLALLESGDRVAAAKFVEAKFSEAFARRQPLARHLEFVSRMHDNTRGFEVQSVRDTGVDSATFLLKSKLVGDWHELNVRVEPNDPGRLAEVRVRPAVAPADAAPSAKLTDAQMAAALAPWLQKLADADVFSGAVLLARGEQVLFAKAYGMANKDFAAPNRIDTKFNLGSMNKMFTSVAIAQLVERGKLAFTDPLAKFLPAFPNEAAAKTVRLEHLLTHTSGLGSFFNQKYQESSRELYRTVDEMLRLADDKELAFEPGTRWQYSNTGMLVLGKVVESASGSDYFDYVRANIYAPAGMTSSDCYELDRVNPNLAVGYDKVFGDAGPTFTNNVFKHVMRGGPAGGGYSTVGDLHRFAVALRAGKLVSAATAAVMQAAKPELQSPTYGYGFQLRPEQRIIGHSGGFPGISSNLDVFLDTGHVAVVMSNYGGGSRLVVERLRQLVVSAQ